METIQIRATILNDDAVVNERSNQLDRFEKWYYAISGRKAWGADDYAPNAAINLGIRRLAAAVLTLAFEDYKRHRLPRRWFGSQHAALWFDLLNIDQNYVLQALPILRRPVRRAPKSLKLPARSSTRLHRHLKNPQNNP